MSAELQRELFQSRFETMNRELQNMLQTIRDRDIAGITRHSDAYIKARDDIYTQVLGIINSQGKD